MTSLSKKPVAKKRGRPLGSKNKSKKIILSRTQVELASKLGVTPVQLAKEKLKLIKKRKPVAKAKAFKQPSNRASEISKLQDKILELEMIRERLHSVIDRQEYKAVQYQAVIDYLETKLELK